MKRTLMILLVGALLPTVLLAGCGRAATQTYGYTDFSRVEVGHAFRVDIVRSNSYSVDIIAPQALFRFIQVTKDGETLRIGLTQPVPLAGGRIEISMPELRGLVLSGATRGTIEGFNSSNSFDLDLSGASTLNGDIKAGDAVLVVSGASKLELDGSCGELDLDASGASGVNLARFPVENAGIVLTGASNATVNVSGRLNTDLSGASRLTYLGEPTLGNISTSGGATLSKG